MSQVAGALVVECDRQAESGGVDVGAIGQATPVIVGEDMHRATGGREIESERADKGIGVSPVQQGDHQRLGGFATICELNSFAYAGHSGGASPGLKPPESSNRVRPDDAIGDQSDLLLETLYRLLGCDAEDPVDLSGVEPERTEAKLQVGDVVPAEHRRSQVEKTVTQCQARLDQRFPGHGIADTGGVELPAQLERDHCLMGGVAEGKALVETAESGVRQSTLEVTDDCAGVASDDREGGEGDRSTSWWSRSPEGWRSRLQTNSLRVSSS